MDGMGRHLRQAGRHGPDVAAGQRERLAGGTFDADGAEPRLGFDLLGMELVIKAGDVPLCAMNVQREGVTGAISSYAPPVPCNGFFEKTAPPQELAGTIAELVSRDN